jgi:hypothetical protein
MSVRDGRAGDPNIDRGDQTLGEKTGTSDDECQPETLAVASGATRCRVTPDADWRALTL